MEKKVAPGWHQPDHLQVQDVLCREKTKKSQPWGGEKKGIGLRSKTQSLRHAASERNLGDQRIGVRLGSTKKKP